MSVYESIMQGLNEAVEYEKGNVKARTATISVAPIPDIDSDEVKSIRNSLNMTQVIFAAVMGKDRRGLGKRHKHSVRNSKKNALYAEN